MDFAYLDDVTLREVRKASIDARFYTDENMAALGSDISPAFWGTVTLGHGPAKLITALGRMNEVRNLVGGEVPLKKFLNVAILLAAGRAEEEVFRRALAMCSPDAVPSPAIPDVAELPRVDGGALEIAIDEDDTIEVAFLHRGAEASRSVAKLLVQRHFDGQASFLAGDQPDHGLGTGWMIAPRLMISNHHVVEARTPTEASASPQDFILQGKATTVQFDYYARAMAPTSNLALECVAHDPNLDFALLRLPADAPQRPALRLRANPISKPSPAALRHRVNLLQHPEGDAMRLGFRNNFVVTGSAEKLSYLTDTAGGSSGSPVCDDAWHVAALHRGWQTIETPVRIWGQEISQENYGTPMNKILDYLKTQHVDLHDEIQRAQHALADS